MLLKQATIQVYKCIDDSGPVSIDDKVTVLVGQNEAGKSAFLEALHKANSVDDKVDYDVVEDYPRKGLGKYQPMRQDKPAAAAMLVYQMDDAEVEKVNRDFGFPVLSPGATFRVDHKYDGHWGLDLAIPEEPYISDLVDAAALPPDLAAKCKSVPSIRHLIELLGATDLNTQGREFLDCLHEKFDECSWPSVLLQKVYTDHVRPMTPKFSYFSDYCLLPGKVNLTQLHNRVQNNQDIDDEQKTVLALLRMAGVSLDDMITAGGYEPVKAKLEAISNQVTDMVFDYWTQNQDLDVEFDVRTDSEDAPPYNNGNNLYIRVRNRKHRVSVPFSQRSKGFIWFFSFIVWFHDVTEQIGTDSDVILLLDEPGLNLHALAQADFLRYIDDLSENHQILYTTHSPFMVHSDRLHQVRMVEDRPNEGTRVTDDLSGSDPKSLFPLQAALGYTIAQNLFIAKRNLLVEGPADLIYIRYFSDLLEEAGHTSLRDDLVIVPVGGLDKLATFIALLRGNKLSLAVVHDYSGKPDPHLQTLVQQKLIQDTQVLHYGMFRNGLKEKAKPAGTPTFLGTDVEDLMSEDMYLRIFNGAYANELKGTVIKTSDLPPGDRVVERLGRYLADNAISVRPTPGFNHYRVASHLASNPIPMGEIDRATLDHFEALCTAANKVVAR